MGGERLTIGQVARRAGVHVETVRYYQRRGLIETPPRPYGGVRRYGPEVVDRIRFVKRAQRLGFSLEEIGELLQLGTESCADVSALAQRKCREIDRQIRALGAMKAALEALLDACRGTGRPDACPLVETLLRLEDPAEAGSDNAPREE
ncbi:MAG: MerR family transcriptional regulator [Gammaproteobacteria bacterium]|nr:MAG: MerR family transcriptional regulator [Gammaproteobacteria bacterium]